ncbi:hypothetical protein GCM10009765_71580 [Fodinicola feengrottensis]|uniref:PPM-type phosphatase domain-containing protein n=1 Tax=Fodinicola feengrottensis TaxID=435914 RepID=A0ABN2IUN2_9ACTN
MIKTAQRLRTGAATHPGRVRENNQDSYFAGERLIVVADGVGGAAGGEVASAAAIAAMSAVDTEQAADSPDAAAAAFISAGDDAAARIRAATEAKPELAGMGTTLSAFLLTGDQIVMAHAGDSRAYRLRGGEMVQLSKDDSYVQLLIDRGSLRPEDAESHPQRNLVTKVLQTDPVDLSLRKEFVELGDRYLVCSDGLTGVVHRDIIVATLGEVADPTECANELIELALERGAPDNVTAVIGDVIAEEPEPEPEMPPTVKLPIVDAEVAATGAPVDAPAVLSIDAPGVMPALAPEPEPPVRRGFFARVFGRRHGRRRR